jgi:hypothetical protein
MCAVIQKSHQTPLWSNLEGFQFLSMRQYHFSRTICQRTVSTSHIDSLSCLLAQSLTTSCRIVIVPDPWDVAKKQTSLTQGTTDESRAGNRSDGKIELGVKSKIILLWWCLVGEPSWPLEWSSNTCFWLDAEECLARATPSCPLVRPNAWWVDFVSWSEQLYIMVRLKATRVVWPLVGTRSSSPCGYLAPWLFIYLAVFRWLGVMLSWIVCR